MRLVAPRMAALAIALLMLIVANPMGVVADEESGVAIDSYDTSPVSLSTPAPEDSIQASLTVYYLNDAVVAGDLTFSTSTPDAGTQTVSVTPSVAGVPALVETFVRDPGYSYDTNVSGSWQFRMFADVELGTQGVLRARIYNTGVQLNTGAVVTSALITPQGTPTLFTWSDSVPSFVAGGAQIVSPTDTLSVEIYYTPSLVQPDSETTFPATSYDDGTGTGEGFVDATEWAAGAHGSDDATFLTVTEEETDATPPGPVSDTVAVWGDTITNNIGGAVWNGAAWAAQDTGVSGVYAWHAAGATCPTRNENIMITKDTSATAQLRMHRWDGVGWTDTILDANADRLVDSINYDVEYEHMSGTAIILAATNAAGNGALSLWTYDGTTLSGPTTVTVTGLTGAIEGVDIAQHPSASSDDLMVAVWDANDDLVGFRWDGTSFVQFQLLDTALDVIGPFGTKAAVEYNSISNNAWVIWADTTVDNNIDGWRYVAGTGWDGAAQIVYASDADTYGVKLAADPASNHMMALYTDSGNDLHAVRFNGGTGVWENHIELDASIELGTRDIGDLAFESASGYANGVILVYGDANSQDLSYCRYTWATNAWTGVNSALDINAACGGDIRWVQVERDAIGRIHVMALHDAAGATPDILHYEFNSVTGAWIGGTVLESNAPDDAGTEDRRGFCLAVNVTTHATPDTAFTLDTRFTVTGITQGAAAVEHRVVLDYTTSGADNEGFQAYAWNKTSLAYDFLGNLPFSATEQRFTSAELSADYLQGAGPYSVTIALVGTAETSADATTSSIDLDVIWISQIVSGASLTLSYDSPAQDSSVRIPEARYFAEDWFEFKWTRGWNLWSMPLLRSENPALGMSDLHFSYFARAHHNDTALEPTFIDDCTLVSWTGAAYQTYVHPADEYTVNDIVVVPDRGYWVRIEESWFTDEATLSIAPEGIYVTGQYPFEFGANRNVAISAGWNLLGWTSYDSTTMAGSAMLDHFTMAVSANGIRQPELACNWTAEEWSIGARPTMTQYDGNKTYTSFIRIGTSVSPAVFDFRLGPGYAFWVYSETGTQTFTYPTS